MWGTVKNRAAYVSKALAFTGDHRKYGRFMQQVIYKWPLSCENALTDYNLNRRAWIGHAAVALAIGCPEDLVRKAWSELSDEQRTLANAEADRAIRTWEHAYEQSLVLREVLAGTLLPGGYTG